ncbi:MAG: diaminopimelate epimerase [Bacteroidota bacterium]
MSQLRFTKMQGAGNDFVVFDNRTHRYTLEEIIVFSSILCDRKYGIGADGIMALQPPERPDVDFTMLYRNADGSDAGMCGNGARCLSIYAHSLGLPDSLRFNVHHNVYKAIVAHNQASIHFPVTVSPKELTINGVSCIKADTATEHLVFFVPSDQLQQEEQLIRDGRALREDPSQQPKGTNVNFVHQDGTSRIELQTYERGVENLTLACGTGALASAIATHQAQGGKAGTYSYTVIVKGGQLGVDFTLDPETKTYHELVLTGPAEFVFEGSIEI